LKRIDLLFEIACVFEFFIFHVENYIGMISNGSLLVLLLYISILRICSSFFVLWFYAIVNIFTGTQIQMYSREVVGSKFKRIAGYGKGGKS